MSDPNAITPRPMTGFCPHCGHPVMSTDIFCHKCGEPMQVVKRSVAPAPAQPEQPAKPARHQYKHSSLSTGFTCSFILATIVAVGLFLTEPQQPLWGPAAMFFVIFLSPGLTLSGLIALVREIRK